MPVAEIVSVGSELLLGQILNSNAQFFARELAELGIDCCWQVTVGDNHGRIVETVRAALDRSDIVITTGGLGPTADDLTTACIADLLGVEMIFDPEIMGQIEIFISQRGYTMPESNRKQAFRPNGSDVLPNPVGTAPGIIWQVDSAVLRKMGIKEPERKRVILTFPGVPSEMEFMWRQTAKLFLCENFAGGAIFSCQLKHYGIGESALAEKYADLLSSTNPSVAPLAGKGECRLRVTAKAATLEEAQALVEPMVNQIKTNSGDFCYGTDDDTLESVVGKLLIERGMTLSLAESCTGGLASKRLTDVPGSSKYTKLNVVAYANEIKQQVLGVHQYLLDTKGAVSSECAHAMATGVRKMAQSDIGVGITGVAGPDGGTPEKPVGLVYLGLVAEHHQESKVLNFGSTASRSEIRQRTVSEALNMVRLYLLKQQ